MSELHALLIGIDDYFPDRLPDGTQYPSLQGATGDVMRVAHLLLERAGLKPERLRMLLSHRGKDGQPAEPPPLRPTYQNMVAAFRRLAEEAQAKDRVYIHYSGHGTRTLTEYPGIKGRMAKDEALVPCDIGAPGSRYLRDLELATLVQLLLQRDLLVTLVLDCCHAGGAMRSRAIPRGVPWANLDPVPSAVADPETMTRIWGPLRSEEVAYRGLSLQSWNTVSKGYVLFAACRPNEMAFEYPFDKKKPQGALTYWLLETLTRNGLRQSCDEIHQRLLSRVRGHFVHQNPVILGDGERLFLSPERVVQRATPRVLRAPGDGRVLIDVGRALGIRPGDRYEMPDGLYEAHQVGATETWVKRVKAYQGGIPVEPGEPVGVLPPRSAIHLVPAEPGDALAERALARLREALKSSDGFVKVEDEGAVAHLRVAVNGQGGYEIQDAAGLAFPHLGPLLVKTPGTVMEVVRRLNHLTRFSNILRVDNPKAPGHLRIGLELLHDETAEPLTTRSVDLKVGEGVILRVLNRSTLRLDFAVLDLQPDYGVTQLLPARGNRLLALDPGEGKIVRVKAWLPPGIEEGRDILKVFATLGAASFRWLELPPLCKPEAPVFRGTPKKPLEKLFAQLAGNAPLKRGLTPSEFPEEEWITAQMEVRVRRE